MPMEISGRSSRGAGGPVNEDAIYYPAGPGDTATPTQLAAHGHLLAVADGQGGPAAALVVQELAAQYYAQVGANAAENLRRAIHETNARIFERMKEIQGHQAGTGATLVAAVIKHGLLYPANVGTGHAVLIRAGECWPLTRVHVQENGMPSRRMAISPFLDPDIFLPLALEPGDRVLLYSDGLVPEGEEVLDWVRLTGRGSAESIADTLIAHAREAGSSDDASVIVGLAQAARPESSINGRQRIILLVLGLLAIFLLFWFILELWWTFAG